MKHIGFVGSGIMASGMALQYLQANHHVTIWNRTRAHATPLLAKGAQWAETPRAVAEQADIIFEVTANDESSQSVWQGGSGIMAGARSEKTVITSATLTAQWTDTLAEICRARDLTFFDIPLTGGRAAAESGNLTLLVGGDKTKLASLKPDLEPICSKIFYFGKAGSGMRYKLILNGIQAAHMVAFGEAMKLAVSQGLSPADVGPALVDRPGGAITNIAWSAYPKTTIPLTFSVNWITKDLEYARAMGGDQDLPILSEVLSAYQKLRDAGFGEEDFARIVQAS